MILEELCLENVKNTSNLIDWLNLNIDENQWMSSFEVDKSIDMESYHQLLIEPNLVKGHWIFLFEKENNEKYFTVLFVEDNRSAKILTLTFISISDIVDYWYTTKDDEYVSVWEDLKEQCDSYNKISDENLGIYEFLMYLYKDSFYEGIGCMSNMYNQWFFHDVNKKNFSIKRFEKIIQY